MSETELAWAAGFFDGEGWFSVNSGTRGLEMGVGQKERSTLERFQDAVGLGVIYRERNNTFYSLRFPNAAAQLHVIAQLWPHLSGPKRVQFRDALADLRNQRASLTRRVRAVEQAYDEMEEVTSGS